ncbi:MAG: iron-sulfur cluster assembly protein [Candidatus Berkiellales bacterium]
MTDQLPLEDKVLEILKMIYDPEIPVNMVDLGLIYSIKIQNNNVHIQMTLTNPGCPVAAQFPEVVKSHLSTLPEVNDITIEMVWDPPWTPERMSEAARLQLGLMI